MPTELAGVYQLRQAKIWQRKNRAADTRPLIPYGSAGFQLAEDLQPGPGEAIIDKITMSAFEGTPLNIVLRDCGVRAYLIAGVAMEVGLDPTVRHSAALGHIPIVVRGACGAGNQSAGEWAMSSIAFAGDAFVVDTENVCAILNSHRCPSCSQVALRMRSRWPSLACGVQACRACAFHGHGLPVRISGFV